MSRSIKRKIIVDEIKYFWVLDGNNIDGLCDTHIRVHKEGTTNCILYIDPYNWHFEVKPKVVAEAIQFALNVGWKPSEKSHNVYISYNESGFYVLPKGIKFGFQI